MLMNEFIIMTVMMMALVLYNFRELISEKINGTRFQRWHILDTGQRGYSITNKPRTMMKVLGIERTINRNNVQNGMAFYTLDCVENLKIDFGDNGHWMAYCNTDEFNLAINQKLLSMLLQFAEKNLIIFCLIVIIIGVAVSGYGVYLIHNQENAINFIANRVNSSIAIR